MKNFYQILAVAEDATNETIKAAYRKLAKTEHPDKNGGSEKSKISFQEIQEAYEHLSHSEKRMQHDNALASLRKQAEIDREKRVQEERAKHNRAYSNFRPNSRRSNSTADLILAFLTIIWIIALVGSLFNEPKSSKI